MKKIKSISLTFPLYKDRNSVKEMILKSLNILKKTKCKYEIVIVDDGCPQHSGILAKQISKNNKNISIPNDKVDELSKKYNLDGIHYDYIRFHNSHYGYNEIGLSEFKNKHIDKEIRAYFLVLRF